MTTEVESALISILTGLAVALLVYLGGYVVAKMKRRSAVSKIAGLIEDFEERLESAQDSEDGTIKKEMLRFAYLEEHLDNIRSLVSVHSPWLSQDQYTSVMAAVDGHTRIKKMLPPGAIPSYQLYANYLADMRKHDWLRT